MYITGCSLLAFILLYAFGNLTAIDAFFLAVSGNTESGLNTHVGPPIHNALTFAYVRQQLRPKRP
jgi:hypothetical protein